MSFASSPAEDRVRRWRARNLTCVVSAPEPVAEPRPPELRERLAQLRDSLGTGLIERDVPLRLALLAALSGEHLLLIGPPGTAKSELARRLQLAFREASWFERLLTRFSVPEELFGPLSIKALEDDRYVRQVDGYLPSASIAFIDEVFKANSAILNALLTLLNEREFDNGCERMKTPLLCVVAASNELPDGPELAALYDRFLLRCHVPPISDRGFEQLLRLEPDDAPRILHALQLTRADLERIRDESRAVSLPGEVVSLMKALRRHLNEQRIEVSDRRWRKMAALLRVAAYTDGRSGVSLTDCWLLQHCTWSEPEQREAIEAWLRDRLGTAGTIAPERFARLVETWERKLVIDLRARAEAEDRARSEEARSADELDADDVILEEEFDPTDHLLPSLLRAGENGPKPEAADSSDRPAAPRARPISSLGPAIEPRFLPPPDCRGRPEHQRSYGEDELLQYFFDRWERVVQDHYYFDDTSGTLYFKRYVADPANLAPIHLLPASAADPHLQARLDATSMLLGDLQACAARVRSQVDSVAAIEAHLWLPREVGARLRQELEATEGRLEALTRRADAVRAAYLAMDDQP